MENRVIKKYTPFDVAEIGVEVTMESERNTSPN